MTQRRLTVEPALMYSSLAPEIDTDGTKHLHLIKISFKIVLGSLVIKSKSIAEIMPSAYGDATFLTKGSLHFVRNFSTFI